jgi:excisionase family DNA binding protein
MMTPSNDSAISPSPNGADTVLVIRVDVASLAQQIATHLARELMSVVASPSPWLDVDRAAEHLSCSPERLRKLVSRRALPFHQERSGGRIFFHRRELDEWLLAK